MKTKAKIQNGTAKQKCKFNQNQSKLWTDCYHLSEKTLEEQQQQKKRIRRRRGNWEKETETKNEKGI